MYISEIVEPSDIKTHIQYHDHLNPDLWDGWELNKKVNKKLDSIARQFEKFLKIEDLKVVDRVITGSMSNYNWTPLSDIDLHIIVDITKLKERDPSFVDEYLQSKKKIWNDLHDIKIFDYEVELYAQDKDEAHISSGVYSIKKDKWLTKPEHKEPSFDDNAVRVKAAHLMNRIDKILPGECSSLEEIQKLKDKIKKMRKAGLEKAGEFSTENLTFKVLRNEEYLKKLFDAYHNAYDDCLSYP